MSSVTSLTPLPYPDPTDQPFVHLDLKALAEQTTESLFVAQSAAPAHKPGRRWYNTTTKLSSISDGTNWRPAVGEWATFAPALVGLAATLDRARVSQQGLRVDWLVAYTVTGAATGTMEITLPGPAAAFVDPLTPVGIAVASAGSSIVTAPAFMSGANKIQIRHTDTGAWGLARPFAWAAGNRFAASGWYEAAA